MKRFWAELISSLYNIKDGIIKKKQEDEAEKEELRNQIAELQQNSNNSQDSIVVEPFAMLQIGSGGKILKLFDKTFIDYGPALALYRIEDFEQSNNNNNNSLPVDDEENNADNLSLKYNKIYFLNISSRRLYNSDEQSAIYFPFLDINRADLYESYQVIPFVQNGQAYDFFKANDYALSLESFRIEGLETEDLNNLYFIVGTNVS